MDNISQFKNDQVKRPENITVNKKPIPNIIWKLIFSYLNLKSILSCASVCKLFNYLIPETMKISKKKIEKILRQKIANIPEDAYFIFSKNQLDLEIKSFFKEIKDNCSKTLTLWHIKDKCILFHETEDVIPYQKQLKISLQITHQHPTSELFKKCVFFDVSNLDNQNPITWDVEKNIVKYDEHFCSCKTRWPLEGCKGASFIYLSKLASKSNITLNPSDQKSALYFFIDHHVYYHPPFSYGYFKELIEQTTLEGLVERTPQQPSQEKTSAEDLIESIQKKPPEEKKCIIN